MKREHKFKATFESSDSGKETTQYISLLKNFEGLENLDLAGTDYMQKSDWLQYTGLKDKKGNEIYHKDSVQIFGVVNTVELYNGAFGYFIDERMTEFISFTQNQHLKIENGVSPEITLLN